MTEIEELRREVADLRKLVEAVINRPCVYEARTWDGRMFGGDRAWCQTHGFDCPNLAVGR
jgi:hypothetical protein